MRRTFTLIRKETNEIDGIISTYLEHIEDFDYNKTTHTLVSIPPDHPILRERQRDFRHLDGEIVKRPQADIDAADAAEQLARQQRHQTSDVVLLLGLVNELRTDKGLPPANLDNLRGQQ